MSLWVGDVVLDGAPVNVLVDGGTITEIGPDAARRPGDEMLDGGGRALTPGLVNGHGHAAMTLFRGYGDDLPLREWLETRIWPAEGLLTREDVYWGTRLACLEMIRSGTTRFWDMYWFQFDVARAVVDSGIRGAVSQVYLAFEGAPDEARPEAAAEGVARLAEFGDRVTPCLGPHAIYTVEKSVLVGIGELSAARSVPIQIHLSETEAEVRDCIADHGCRPAEYLDRVGMLTPDTILSHGVWLDPAELDLVAERGATIVTNPVSNMKLTVGRAFPYPAARAAGIPIGLGTDGAASNNSLDLLADLKILALLQKHSHDDPKILPAAEAWAVATGALAPRLGGTPVAVGQPADFLLVDADAVEMAPAPLVDALVYSASGTVVDSVVIDGQVVMTHRHVEGEEEVRARAVECARRVRPTP